MNTVSGALNIIHTRAHGWDRSENEQDHLTNFKSVFGIFPANAAEDAGSSAGRATKRRKVDNKNSPVNISTEKFDETTSAVLGKIELDLHFPEDDVAPWNISDALHSPLVVSLETFSKKGPHDCLFTLWNSEAIGLEIIATATPEFLDSITRHLEIATWLTATKEGRKRSNKPGVSFSRCLLIPHTEKRKCFLLQVQIRWLLGVSVVESPSARTIGRRDLQVMSKYLPDTSKEKNESWQLSDFYDSVHVPSIDRKISPRIDEALMSTQLYPFQRRTVDWLLEREGVTLSDTGDLLETPRCRITDIPFSFESIKDTSGNLCYRSSLRGLVVSDISTIVDPAQALQGGILAEEMGLGKTVELIALMIHHKRTMSSGTVFDAYTRTSVRPSGATLIITPPSILEQWKNEINHHAPGLRVFHYEGFPSLTATEAEHKTATVDHLLQFDVVLTTYHVLSKEVHWTSPPPDRSLRQEKKYERRRSPLVEISWWRVCLDEAQMVESGVSQAATVARTIPRCNAWAVSGTPLRKNVQDLRGLLIFLRYEPFASCKALWNRLDKASFRAIFGTIALRHTKDKIRKELPIPPQKRVVITVPFTAVEEQNYAHMMSQMCDECWLSPEGLPLQNGRGIDHPDVIERMRDWLVRLRQTCLHAQVGAKNRKALGAKNGALRTVDEVLEVMIEQNDAALKSEAREGILFEIQIGHVRANQRNNERRSLIALESYEKALGEAQSYVEACRGELEAEKEKLSSTTSKKILDSDAEDDDENEEDNEKQSEHLGRLPVARKSLRSFLELKHVCMFHIGTAYFQIKSNENLTKPDSQNYHDLEKLEVEWYDKAKAIRQELLKESQRRAQRHMKRLSSKAAFHPISEIVELPDLAGIESRATLDMMDRVSYVLNNQASQIQEWRSKIISILLLPLVDQEEKETTGDEYEDSTKAQDELYVYIMALQTLIADRSAAISGLEDLLANHEIKEAERLAKSGEGHAPELVLKICATRSKLRPKPQDGTLKAIISNTRSLIQKLQPEAEVGNARAMAELDVAQKYFSRIQTINAEQVKALSALEKEQDLFRATMNHRLEFYRQLQHISDTVAPWREELDNVLDQRALATSMEGKRRKQARVATLETKKAYLANLRRENQQDGLAHECVICQDTFEIGVLTSCGHKYCKECINQWWYQHRTCPLCKQRLRGNDFINISLKPTEIKAHEENHEAEGHSQPSTPSSSNASIYSDISDSTMREIKLIDLDGSYGSKVDMIARHVLWIRHNDPGAKTIIFSQFSDFLEVLRGAFKTWKIGVSGIKDHHGIHLFRSNPAIECFLLDAKSDSSGLNLVNATNVILCEPLINPAIELQAIARVHRIGQKRATTVFMYLVSDTVEEAIYDISVSRRLEHIKTGEGGSKSGLATAGLEERRLDAANSMELEAAPVKQLLRKKGDGEIVKADDLWTCLFGRQKKKKAGLEEEVGRHLRAEAAEGRMAEAGASS